MPECPYCGKWFKTKKGLEQHITKVHKVDTPFGKALNPASFDFMGKLRERKSVLRGVSRGRNLLVGLVWDLEIFLGHHLVLKRSLRRKRRVHLISSDFASFGDVIWD